MAFRTQLLGLAPQVLSEPTPSHKRRVASRRGRELTSPRSRKSRSSKLSHLGMWPSSGVASGLYRALQGFRALHRAF